MTPKDRDRHTTVTQAKILVVDDMPANAELLAGLLRRHYQVSTAFNGQDALDEIAYDKPDLILLDVIMPGLNGFQVCEQLKANQETHEIPVIFVTANHDPFQETRGFQVGAVDFILKPIRPQIVLARVNTHLELKKRQESLQTLSTHLEQRVHEEVEKNLKGQQRYQTLLETMHDGLFILDKDRHITFMNDRFCEIVGQSRTDLLGQVGKNILTKTILEQFQSCQQGQQDYYEVTFNKETSEPTHTIVSPKPLIDEHGHFEGCFATVTDITERKKIEIELKRVQQTLQQRVEERTCEYSKVLEDLTHSILKREQLENNLKVIMDNTRSLIFIKDIEGGYLLTNRTFERMVARTRNEILGQRDQDFFPPQVATRLQSIDQEVLKQKSHQETEEEIPHADGTQHIYLTSKFPLLDAQDNPRGVCGIATDITERKQMEAALRKARDELEQRVWERTQSLTEVNKVLMREIADHRQAEAEKLALQEQALHNARLACLGEMSANVAHEINNPNVAIGFNAEILITAWRDVVAVLLEYQQEHQQEQGDIQIGGLNIAMAIERFPKLQHDIMKNSIRIKDIVNNFKKISRPSTGDLNALVDIREILQSAVAILEIQIKKHTDHLTLDLPAHLPTMRGNFQQLEQVFINIIQNALQALPNREGKIHGTVTVDPGYDTLSVCITDEGTGIPDAILDRLLQPFFTTKSKTGGTGLGLSISATIVRNHRGSMKFQSEPGLGTKVTVQLPLKHSNMSLPV